MPTMGRRCVAYPHSTFMRFNGWAAKRQNAATEETLVDDRPVLVPRQLTNDSILYLQDDLTVSDGIFIDQNIIFDERSPEWEMFCREELAWRPIEELVTTAG